MKFQFAAVASMAALVSAAPTPDTSLEQRQDSQYRLPSTVILLATLSNGTVIGSIKGDGNFTTKRFDYPFRVYYTSGNNGNDGNICSGGSCCAIVGPLDGAQFNCSQGTAPSTYGQFWDRDGFVSVDGPTGIAFSINSLPGPNDNVGVPTIIGGSGAWGQFRLQAHSASG